MLDTVLQRFPVQRMILVVDRGLISLDSIGALTALADQGGRTLEFILAVPARRYGELVETFRHLAFDADGLRRPPSPAITFGKLPSPQPSSSGFDDQ